LILFAQIADGVDDQTRGHHLRAGDYSNWFRDIIKDQDLSKVAAAIEEDRSLSAADSRKKISGAITERYTAPS
jgi:hypothetical protein